LYNHLLKNATNRVQSFHENPLADQAVLNGQIEILIHLTITQKITSKNFKKISGKAWLAARLFLLMRFTAQSWSRDVIALPVQWGPAGGSGMEVVASSTEA
jgi:hypothetical protein